MAKLMVHRNILKAFHKLPSKVQKRVSELIEEFQHDPQSPAIGMHPLSGTMLDPKVRGVTKLPDGYRAIVIAPESNARLALEDVERFLAAARPGELLLLQNECAHLEACVELAARAGLRTWLNAAPANDALAGLSLETLAGLVVNETEAEALSGHAEPGRALGELAPLLPRGTVVVTLGPGGAIAWERGHLLEFRGHRVNAVDTVGCGDAFVGAMLATLASGGPLDRAIMRGNAAGAIAATREGAMPSLPSASEIDALVATLGA